MILFQRESSLRRLRKQLSASLSAFAFFLGMSLRLALIHLLILGIGCCSIMFMESRRSVRGKRAFAFVSRRGGLANKQRHAAMQEYAKKLSSHFDLKSPLSYQAMSYFQNKEELFRLLHQGNRRGDMEELIQYIGWAAFAVVVLGALYFLIRRFIT